MMGLDGKIASLTMNINVLCSARLIPTVSLTRLTGSQGPQQKVLLQRPGRCRLHWEGPEDGHLGVGTVTGVLRRAQGQGFLTSALPWAQLWPRASRQPAKEARTDLPATPERKSRRDVTQLEPRLNVPPPGPAVAGAGGRDPAPRLLVTLASLGWSCGWQPGYH